MKRLDQLYDAAYKESNGVFSLLYVNKKEALSVLHRTSHQLSGTMIPHDGFYHSIREKNSPVKPKMNNVTESIQFKKWFGDWQKDPVNASKIVNSDGTPKVMYHGTQNDFTVFDENKIGQGATLYASQGFGFYFTESKESANNYAKGKQIVDVYLDVKKPLTFVDKKNKKVNKVLPSFRIGG